MTTQDLHEYKHSAAYISKLTPAKFSMEFFNKSIIVAVPYTDIPGELGKDSWINHLKANSKSFGTYHFDDTYWSVIVYSNITDNGCQITISGLQMKDLCNGWDLLSSYKNYTIDLAHAIKSFKAYTYKNTNTSKVFVVDSVVYADDVRDIFKNIIKEHEDGAQAIVNRLFETFNRAKAVANPSKNYIELGMDGGGHDYNYHNIPLRAMKIGGVRSYAMWKTPDEHRHFFGCYRKNIDNCGCGNFSKVIDATEYERKERDRYWRADVRNWSGSCTESCEYHDTITTRTVYKYKLNKDDWQLINYVEKEIARLDEVFSTEWKSAWKIITGIDL